MSEAIARRQWLESCRSGSSWTTIVELEFHHVMSDPENPSDDALLAPFPPHAVDVHVDARSNCLLWLVDGTPAHAQWCHVTRAFRRVGDGTLIESTSIRAWAALPCPLAAA